MRHGEHPVTMVVDVDSGGLAGAIAERLAGAGHHVCVVSRDKPLLDALPEKTEGIERSLRTQRGDPTVLKRIRRYVDDMLIHYGRVDALVYCTRHEAYAPALEADEAEVTGQLGTTLWGPWYWMKALVPVMREHGGGRLLFLATGPHEKPAGSGHVVRSALQALVTAVSREHKADGIDAAAVLLDADAAHDKSVPPAIEDILARETLPPGGEVRIPA